jgi:outer membrane protein, heavy metal efflux system
LVPATAHAVVLAAGLWMLAGCTHFQPRPISPDSAGAALTARSLQGEDLHRFLTQNLGRELVPWPPPKWDFEMLTLVAFYYQPSLEVARAQWDVARSAVQTAAARPNPVLSVTPGYDTSVPAGTSPWFPAINLDFLLETASKRDHRVAIEQLTAEAARLEVLASAWQVRNELRRALIEVVVAGRRHDVLRQQTGLQQELLSLLERRLAAGAVSSLEVSAARLALVKSEASAADAQRQEPLARGRLAEILGVPLAALDGVVFDDPLVRPQPAFTVEELAGARRESLRSRSDVLAALARYEATQNSLQLEVARQYPDFHVGPGYQYDLGENKWSVALSLELPRFNRNAGPIAEAEARRHEAAARFTATQAHVIAEIDGAAAAHAAAVGQLAHLLRVWEELQDQTARLQIRLDAGDADRLELQNAKIELVAGESALLESEAGAVLAAGQLQDVLQVPWTNLAAIVGAPRDGTQSHLP